ncbi:glycosyltransferase family 39 protein [Clostridium thermarum]|uniref:glycosyltransferase family 39 protein n=1 Tax=Clostridium thermarum TaxID=1716543 RepID=UPI00111FC2F7|nr:glycosyltransferase family 39 protein [Clostridium thermarum]
MLKKKDYILIFLLTLIYSVIALFNLGTTKVPESFWQPKVLGETFYVDLGEDKELEKISYFVGLGEGTYNVSFSTDKVNWKNRTAMDQHKIFRWTTVDVDTRARYVKFTVIKPDGMLNEIGIFAKGEDKPLPIVELIEEKVSAKGQGSPQLVFDEQQYVQSERSFLTGMYFDELYHGRTAYEMLYKLEHYEWTHPPLGKIFIALGVAIFGMNPFGWRIAGTLFGIAMITCIYILGKRLFKRTEFAFLTAFLLTFDFMHFTQTRIATVDGYAVFFIILMYYFMLKFIETKPSKAGLKKSIVSLGLSGLFFAFGAATKWICIYAAVGLAILFFKEIYDRYTEYKKAVEYLRLENAAENMDEYEACSNIKANFKKHTVKTIGWAVLFFIVIPLAVYIASYIPFMMIPGPGHGLIDVFKVQVRMFSYHNDLVATHPYASPWYEWPIILRPMWYYYGKDYLPAGKMSSIVAMGNPAVWWLGSLAFIAVIIIGLKKKDKVAFFIVLGGLSNYLPWVLVSRITFIYHFFASVPFIILSIVYMAAHLYEKKKSRRYHIYGYMVLVVALFILFYPTISGTVVDESYGFGFLKMFEGW